MTLISRLVFFKDDQQIKKQVSEKIETREISIIIPVKDNQKGINKYLTTFFQTHNKSNYPKEIVIIDNNSQSPVVIDNNFLAFGLKIKLIKCPKPGPAAARNKGANVATGKWLLFNDSDCIPTKSLIKGYFKADNYSVGYAGNIKSLSQDKISKYYISQEILLPLKTFDENRNFVPQYLITANTLVWKKAFDEIGGFNEKFKIAGGEDVDLGLRLSRVGSLSYAFDSIAVHDFSDGIIGFYKRFKRYGHGNRIVEEIWNTDLSPSPFRPNEQTFINNILAKIQFWALKKGYRKFQTTQTPINRV